MRADRKLALVLAVFAMWAAGEMLADASRAFTTPPPPSSVTLQTQ